MPENILMYMLGAVLYFSGLLVWPVYALLWRKRRRRTRALRWVFFSQLSCELVLAGFFFFSRGLMEHQYGWLFLMLVLNVVFTPVALLAAIYDRAAESAEQPSCRSDPRDTGSTPR
jgi:ABC-type phosphate transport system permease subunit